MTGFEGFVASYLGGRALDRGGAVAKTHFLAFKAKRDQRAAELDVAGFERLLFDTTNSITAEILKLGALSAGAAADVRQEVESVLRDAASELDVLAGVGLVMGEQVGADGLGGVHSALLRKVRRELTWQERLILVMLYPAHVSGGAAAYLCSALHSEMTRTMGLQLSKSEFLTLLYWMQERGFVYGLTGSPTMTESVSPNLSTLGPVYYGIIGRASGQA